MSINYANGTVYDTGGSGATNTQNLQTTIKNTILANAAWSLVEDVSVGTLPARWVALKCSAASSGLPNDFYIVMTAQVNSTTINFYLCENYTSGSGRTMAKYAADVNSATSFTPAADGSTSATITAATNGLPNTASPTNAPGIVAINSSIAYWLVVYSDHIVISISSSSSYSYYIGAFTSLVTNAAANDPMPLVQVNLLTNASNPANGGGTTRHPLLGGAASTFLWGVIGPVIYNAINLYPIYTWASPYIIVNGLGYGGADLFQNSAQPVSEALVTMWGGMQVSAKTLGFIRGKYLNMRLMTAPPTGMTVGDQIVLNGTHWVCASIVSGTQGVGCFVDTGA